MGTSQKHRNAENGVKFAVDAKYRRELTKGNPCIIFEPAHRLLIQPRAAEYSSYTASLLSSLFYEARSLQPRSGNIFQYGYITTSLLILLLVWDCDYVSVSYSISYSISYSYSSSVSVSHSESVSYSLSYLVQDCETETQTIPYTYNGTTASYTYSGTTVPYTYTATTIPYTWTSTSTLNMKRNNGPSPSSLSATSFPSSPNPSSTSTIYDLEPGDNREKMKYPTRQMLKPTYSQPTSTSQAPTPSTKTKPCSAMTTFPARSFSPAKEFRENGLVSSSQLSQLLQHVTLA